MMHLRRATPLLILLFGVSAWSRADEVKTLAGKNLTGSVTSVSAGEVLPKEGKIQFKDIDGVGNVDFPLANLQGILFYRTDILQEQPVCRVADTYGNNVTAMKLAFDGKEYSVTTTFGAKIAFKADAISSLD